MSSYNNVLKQVCTTLIFIARMTHLKEKELINEEFDIQFIPSHESSYESYILE